MENRNIINKSNKISSIKYIYLALVILFLSACENPFAPKYLDSPINNGLLNSQTTIEGVFDNFRYAYVFRDTLVYGNLLDPDFTFIFRNYDKGIDESWGRDQEILTTYRMFQATQSMDLIWNDILINVGDTLIRDVSRSFALTIVFNPSDIVRINGIANFRLKWDVEKSRWRILAWRDESNY
ncbi:MAG: hypothetical protein ABFD61_02545 [Chloroherpetonaceae bacterium]